MGCAVNAPDGRPGQLVQVICYKDRVLPWPASGFTVRVQVDAKTVSDCFDTASISTFVAVANKATVTMAGPRDATVCPGDKQKSFNVAVGSFTMGASLSYVVATTQAVPCRVTPNATGEWPGLVGEPKPCC